MGTRNDKISDRGGLLNPLGTTLQSLADEEARLIGSSYHCNHKFHLIEWEPSIERCIICGHLEVTHNDL